MAEIITVTTQLMPNGVRFAYEPAWDESGYRRGLEERLKRVKAYTVMGCTAEIIRKPGYIEFVDRDPPESRWIARGIPIRVNDAQLAKIVEANELVKKEYRFEDHVDVVERDGSKWILSPFAGCRRIAVNVCARLDVAAQLYCEYQVAKGAASWRGQMAIKVEDE